MKKDKTYKILTFGCQMNENDSEKLAGMLVAMGYREGAGPEGADVVIVNTCSVRENAEARAFGNIGKIKTYKKDNPDMVLAMCGCMMQQPENVAYIKEKHPQVDIVFGTHNLNRFPELLARFLSTGEPLVEVEKDSAQVIEDVPVKHKYTFKSFVTIMQGCNNFCSYCIVPYTRGRERSRRPEKIEAEIRALVKNGTVEVTLLGQNVNSYGNDLEDGVNFAALLRRLDRIPGLERIRFMTSNPMDFTDDVIAAMLECRHVMPAVHLAVQSGSDRILKKMNRHYTKDAVINLIRRIRAVPDVCITTDIIVGFPGETEQDFLDTVALVRACRFDNAFSFIYSPRPGTPAAVMDDQIEESVKHARLAHLLDVLRELAEGAGAEYEDRVVDVLFETVSNKDKTRLSGRTPSGKLVHVTAGTDCIGKILPVRITKPGPFSMIGELALEQNQDKDKERDG